MEEYGLDGLAASAEAVLAGLGPLAAGLGRLAVEAGRAVTLEAMEELVIGQGRELLRGLVQLALDAQADREVRLAQVTGEDGVRRGRAERGHGRPVVTRLGEVRVRRIAYRSGIKGVLSLFPRDAVLNLPPLEYSQGLQRLAQMFCGSVSYEQAHAFVLAVTGVSIGKRQLEQIIAAAAADAERFYRDRLRDQEGPAGDGEEDGIVAPLAISADGKGVAMRPEARRRRTRAPDQKVRTFDKRAGTGEKKGSKRMAETGCVFDVLPPEQQRTPEQVMRPDPGSPGKKGPRAENRWYTCDITAGRDVTIGKIFDEADRRDPGHLRTWIALAGGDIYQLGLIQAAAAARGITLVIVIDFIHVLEYLWKTAWCFHPPRDPAMEDWVIAQGLDILHGRAGEVIARIGQLAAARRRNQAASTPRSSAKPCTTSRPSSRTWTTPAPWRTDGRSPPASSKAPAATWSKTGWASPAPAGDCKEPRPSSGCAPSTPAAPPAPTGTTTSPKNTSATTSAATKTASNSPPDTHSTRATPTRHPCCTRGGG